MPLCDLLRQNVSLGVMTSMATAESAPAGSPTYIYIAGRGHSGSTLLTMLLARHRDVEAVGEMSLLSLQIARDESTRWVGRCSCGERPIDCSMWGRVLHDIEREEGVDFRKDPFAWRVSDVGMEEEYRGAAPVRVPFVWLRNRFWRLIRYLQYLSPAPLAAVFSLYKPQARWARNRSELSSRLATVNGVNAIVDASKDPLDMLDIYYNATIPVKIIFLTRDSRGNVWSILRRRLKAGKSRETAVAPAAKDWVKVNSRIWRLAQKIPEKDCLHLKYEDLCRQPAEVMNELFRFVGLEPVDVIGGSEASGEGESTGHTIGGNKIRFSTERLNIREDKAWNDNLSGDEVQTIQRIAGKLSRELGYEA